jgi:hypothetical protein
MAKRIVWSLQASEQKKDILSYWYQRNKSLEYPRKLNNLLISAINLIAEYSYPRVLTDIDGVHVKIVRDYKIFYQEDSFCIYIISIWDTRQDPEHLKTILT